jgi:cytochrome c oxidase subunit 3
MASEHADSSTYYVPHQSAFPAWTALGMIAMLGGLGVWLNGIKATGSGSPLLFAGGFVVLVTVMFYWFGAVIRENHQGLANAQLKRSYVLGMLWFIFSEVMFFAAFFGALFYARTFAAQWLGGEGAKGLSGDYLWPAFGEAYRDSGWPMLTNPDPEKFTPPRESMAAPSSLGAWIGYLPFWNTVILVSSSFTVHWSHAAIKNDNRAAAIRWLLLTVALGFLFVALQAYEYYEAYHHLGLTLASGIYGSTFFMLTGFHGFHVTMGATILLVQLIRMIRGHFKPHDQFGLEAASWYWHFVDVVWIGLFFFVYIF